MKKQNTLLTLVFLMIVSGKIIAQLGPNGLPLYESGELYLQLRLNSTVAIHHKDTVVNDPGGSFQSLFTKYQVGNTDIPFAFLNDPALNKTYKISFADTARVDSFIIDLSLINAHVEYAEKVGAAYSSFIPNDPLATVNGTAFSSAFYYMPLINANQATNIHTGGNATVAIVDDAVLISHEDLATNTITSNWNFDDGNNNPNPPVTTAATSFYSHGTHVAGIACGVTNNGKGIASVGGNNKLMSVRASLNNSTNLYAGIGWAAQNGAHVINMSWGSFIPDITHYQAITFIKNTYDVVLIAGAGNYLTNTPFYPAAYGEGTTGQPWEAIDKKLVVAVSALDQNSDIGEWHYNNNGTILITGSNFGHWVDISAYGTNILSSVAIADASGTYTNNLYDFKSGTSMASPMVAGIAGVMRSYDMSKTADEIIDCLINTANPDIYGSNHPNNLKGTMGSGRVDAEAALQCLSTNCAVTPKVIIVPSTPSLCANTTLTLTANQGANSYSWNTGATTSAIIVNTPGTYSVVATYTSGGGCAASASISFVTPPTLSLSLTTNTAICAGATVNLISASGSFSNLVWQPGGMTTNSVVVNPASNTIYTVTANPFCGGVTATIGVNATTPTFVPYSVLGPTISASNDGYSLLFDHFMIASDAIVSGKTSFSFDEVIVASNAKITVPAASTLNITSSHLHSCGTDMWKGIVVENSGRLNTKKRRYSTPALSFPNSTLIEDAVTAISSTYNPTAPPNGTIHVSNTIFNKNYLDISLTGYNNMNVGFSDILKVDSSVFTCRDFSLNLNGAFMALNTDATPYLQVSGVEYALRSAISSTTGFASPYMHGYGAATLKSPYANFILYGLTCTLSSSPKSL